MDYHRHSGLLDVVHARGVHFWPAARCRASISRAKLQNMTVR